MENYVSAWASQAGRADFIDIVKVILMQNYSAQHSV